MLFITNYIAFPVITCACLNYKCRFIIYEQFPRRLLVLTTRGVFFNTSFPASTPIHDPTHPPASPGRTFSSWLVAEAFSSRPWRNNTSQGQSVGPFGTSLARPVSLVALFSAPQLQHRGLLEVGTGPLNITI